MFLIGLLPNEIGDHLSNHDIKETIEETMLENSFTLEGIDMESQNMSLKFQTNSESSVAISAKIQLISRRVDEGIIYGSVILVALYICIRDHP